MRNHPLFVLLAKSLFLLMISAFAMVAVIGYVQYHDLLIVLVGTLDVVILTALAIWAWGNVGSKSLASAQRIDAEIVTDTGDHLKIPKEDYLGSVIALGDKMASPDPMVRELAALAYDAFKSSVRLQ